MTTKRVLDQSVLIPMGLVASIVIGVGGGSFWLSAMYQRVETTSASVTKMEQKLDVLAKMQIDIEKIKTQIEGMPRATFKASAQATKIRRSFHLAKAEPESAKLSKQVYQPGIYSMTE